MANLIHLGITQVRVPCDCDSSSAWTALLRKQPSPGVHVDFSCGCDLHLRRDGCDFIAENYSNAGCTVWAPDLCVPRPQRGCLLCDRARGLAPSNPVVATAPTRVLLVVPTAPRTLRDRVEQVAKAVKSATVYDGRAYIAAETEREHVLLARFRRRDAGFLILERAQYLHRGEWPDLATMPPGPLEWARPGYWRRELQTTHPSHWTVRFLGVDSGARRSGIATALVNAALATLGVSLADLAWAPPFSPEGDAFARRLYPGDFLCSG